MEANIDNNEEQDQQKEAEQERIGAAAAAAATKRRHLKINSFLERKEKFALRYIERKLMN
ncbi:MAG: hypothetical protein ACI8RD_011703 [Bacillariaceae sp.]|jgi:hypothetical protein